MKMLRRSLTLAAFLIGSMVISYGAMNPFVPLVSNPNVSYKVVSTKYLNVVYEPSSEWAVYQFLKNCDNIYEKITDFYNVQPFSKLTVVFENDTSLVNSVADPVDNVIYIFLNSSQRAFFTQSVGNWVDFVFTHELTHILLTQMGGLPQVRVYGNPLSTIYNSAFIPAYLQEGLAEYSETHFNKEKGRLNDPMFEMYLKGLVLSKRFNGFGGAATYNADGWYPMGAPYIIGGSFIRYISSTFGSTTLKRAIDILSSHHILGVANAFSKATKLPFSKLVNSWISDVKKEVTSQLSRVGEKIVGTQLTHSGRWTAFVSVPSGKSVFFYSESSGDVPRIKEYDISNSTERNVYSLGGFLYEGGYVRSMAISPDGQKLAFVRFVPKDEGFVNQSVCFVLNLKKHSVFQLPLRSPLYVVWVTNDMLAYSKEDGGLYTVREYNLKDGTFRTLMHLSPLVLTSMTAHEGDIYFSAYDGASEDIYELFQDGKVKKIISGPYLKMDPFVSKDGRYVFFSASPANKNGVFNVYVFDTVEKEFYQVTNVELGAFSPLLSENKLFYTSYTKNGYNLFVLDRWTSTLKKVDYFDWSGKEYKNSLNLTEIYLSVEERSKAYHSPFETIAEGLIPGISFSTASSTTLKAKYSVVGFDILRDKLGWNNFYALALLSTDSTEDSLAVGMANYGKYNLSLEGLMNLREQRVDATLSIPISFVMWGRDALLYPEIEYTVKKEREKITDDFNFNGEYIFNPSFVPNNSVRLNSLSCTWNMNFSPLRSSTPTYNVSISTSFPLFGMVSSLGMRNKNSSVDLMQAISFPRMEVGWYNLTGTLGFKSVDLLQFSSFNLTNHDFQIGLQSDFNFDSLFYSEFKFEVRIAYDRLKNGLVYKIGLNF